jgi:HlyD family secretion protein
MKVFSAKWLTVGATFIIAVAAVFFFAGNGQEKVSYRTTTVDRGDILVSVSATGTLAAVTTVQVGSQVSGTIAKLYADYNSVVEEGDLLAQLDPTFLQATVNEQRASVDRAASQVTEAQRTLDRTTQLFERSMISEADRDAAVTTLESAKASLKQAQASLDRAEVNLRYATIRTPISGVVISRNVDVGQTVAASLQAPTLFTIANDLRQMQVETNVDEADIGSVKVGQAVTFRVDAYSENTFAGRVSQIRLAPVTSQNVVTYVVIIAVANPEQLLMPGMTATVSIEVAKSENALRVPLTAFHFSPSVGGAAVLAAKASNRTAPGEPGQAYGSGMLAVGATEEEPTSGTRVRVWVLKDGQPQPAIVWRGIQNTSSAEILRGDLREGDQVIVGTTSGTTTTTTSQVENPLMPRMPGGGPRR